MNTDIPEPLHVDDGADTQRDSAPTPVHTPAIPPHSTATLGPLRRRQADGWSLVLASEDIPHHVLAGADGLYLVVDAADAARASASLSSYVAENDAPAFDTSGRRPPPPAGAPPAGRADVGLGIAAAVALLGSFVATGDATNGAGLAPIGGANSALILDGELWRTVTALTLHAGLGHVLANALASMIFLPLAARRLGIGLALLGTIGAGAVGNAVTAFVRGPGSSGVGFSTALFGAVGLLAGARLVDRDGGGRGGCWIVFGAAMALLALLGSGEQTDVLAHAFGLLAGVPIGAVLARSARVEGGRSADGQAPVAGAGLQWAAAIATIAVVAGAWGMALR